MSQKSDAVSPYILSLEESVRIAHEKWTACPGGTELRALETARVDLENHVYAMDEPYTRYYVVRKYF